MEVWHALFEFFFGTETACLMTGFLVGLAAGFSCGFWLSGGLRKFIVKWRQKRLLKTFRYAMDGTLEKIDPDGKSYCPECFRAEGRIVAMRGIACPGCGFVTEHPTGPLPRLRS